MTAQVIFKIDKKLKTVAQRRARNKGITLSDKSEVPNVRTARELKQAHQDIERGQNLSPRFDDVHDAINYLKRIAGDKW